MAACPKCGKPRVRKNRIYGHRRCVRCGVLGGDRRLDRSGFPPVSESPAIQCDEVKETKSCAN